MLGEPEFDVASFLWNPLGSTMRLDVTERRLAAFAAAGLDEERMRAWAVIRGAYLGADENEERVLRSLVGESGDWLQPATGSAGAGSACRPGSTG